MAKRIFKQYINIYGMKKPNSSRHREKLRKNYLNKKTLIESKFIIKKAKDLLKNNVCSLLFIHFNFKN